MKQNLNDGVPVVIYLLHSSSKPIYHMKKIYEL